MVGTIRHYSCIWLFSFVFILTVYLGTAERILTGGGGLENERRSRKFVAGSGGILPQKIFKSRASEMAFSTLSMRYFSTICPL